jgi:hypothetical protein
MQTFIEPTAAEIKQGHLDAGGADVSWGDMMALGERECLARLHSPDVDGYLAYSRDFTDLVALMCNEGDRRKFPKTGRRRLDQAFYVAMRLDGATHAMADMLASRMPPMSNTDREFLEGHCNGNQFEKTPEVGDWYAKEAKAAGVDITGRVYINSLASRPGDPEAWVSGRGDLERVVRERNWSCQGSSNIKGHEQEGPPDVRIADDLVESRMIDRLEADPTLAFKGHEELFQETREQIQPHWAA